MLDSNSSCSLNLMFSLIIFSIIDAYPVAWEQHEGGVLACLFFFLVWLAPFFSCPLMIDSSGLNSWVFLGCLDVILAGVCLSVRANDRDIDSRSFLSLWVF